MGHAGAIISGTSGRAESKIKSLENSGAWIINSPCDMGKIILEALKKNDEKK